MFTQTTYRRKVTLKKKTFKRPTLPKVTLFGYNLLLANKSVVGTHSWSVLWSVLR